MDVPGRPGDGEQTKKPKPGKMDETKKNVDKLMTKGEGGKGQGQGGYEPYT